MKRRFTIRNLKICSINNAYATRDRRKKKETIMWLFDLKVQLYKHKQHIQDIKNNFMPKRNFLTIDYYWILPYMELFTKRGTINLRSGDWSNFPKIPDDLVLNEVLGIDDGAVCKGSVFKLPWKKKTHAIIIEVSIHELDQLWKKANLVIPESIR